MGEAGPQFPTTRQRAFEILEHGRRRDFASRIVDWILVVLILADVAGTIAQTLPRIEGPLRGGFPALRPVLHARIRDRVFSADVGGA